MYTHLESCNYNNTIKNHIAAHKAVLHGYQLALTFTHNQKCSLGHTDFAWFYKI